VAIIVSEQTGSISIAIDGMIKRRLSRDVFESMLKNELMQRRRRKPKSTDNEAHVQKVEKNDR